MKDNAKLDGKKPICAAFAKQLPVYYNVAQ